jgi:hypothetical protein
LVDRCEGESGVGTAEIIKTAHANHPHLRKRLAALDLDG